VSEQAHAFPWREFMVFGLGHLRLAPRDFWAMTPRELAAAMDGVAGVRPGPMARGDLDALVERFPDGTRQ
jgi:uncharacterized phage protein (TIGR02216 family)